MSSVSVSCCQPPASSMARRRHMPAVPLKLKKTPLRGPSRMFEHEMAVEQNGFNFGQKRIMAVNVCPARLHHADFRVGEVMDAVQQEIRRRNKIGVKDGENSPLAVFNPRPERPALNPSRLSR